MSVRSFGWLALGLALSLAAVPASAVTLTVLSEVDLDLAYDLRLMVAPDGGADATFSSCADASCLWDVDITFSEDAGGLVTWSGSGSHVGAEAYSFAGAFGTVLQGTAAHGAGTDFYGVAHPGQAGEFLLTGRHVGKVPEPATALLVATALALALRSGLRFRSR